MQIELVVFGLMLLVGVVTVFYYAERLHNMEEENTMLQLEIDHMRKMIDEIERRAGLEL